MFFLPSLPFSLIKQKDRYRRTLLYCFRFFFCQIRSSIDLFDRDEIISSISGDLKQKKNHVMPFHAYHQYSIVYFFVLIDRDV